MLCIKSSNHASKPLHLIFLAYWYDVLTQEQLLTIYNYCMCDLFCHYHLSHSRFLVVFLKYFNFLASTSIPL